MRVLVSVSWSPSMRVLVSVLESKYEGLFPGVQV